MNNSRPAADNLIRRFLSAYATAAHVSRKNRAMGEIVHLSPLLLQCWCKFIGFLDLREIRCNFPLAVSANCSP